MSLSKKLKAAKAYVQKVKAEQKKKELARLKHNVKVAKLQAQAAKARRGAGLPVQQTSGLSGFGDKLLNVGAGLAGKEMHKPPAVTQVMVGAKRSKPRKRKAKARTVSYFG